MSGISYFNLFIDYARLKEKERETMQGGMTAYATKNRETDQHAVARTFAGLDMLPSQWQLDGHTLASEHVGGDLYNEKLPANQWRWDMLYKGDSTEEVHARIWSVIEDQEFTQPYVLLLLRYGDVYRRIDLC